jgi:hypothetical protein
LPVVARRKYDAKGALSTYAAAAGKLSFQPTAVELLVVKDLEWLLYKVGEQDDATTGTPDDDECAGREDGKICGATVDWEAGN